MKLVLHYRGKLNANGKPDHKHDLRRHFHQQLATLWKQAPLSDQPGLLGERRTGEYSLLRPLGSFIFAPLITNEMNVVAELSITLLRPESPGHLITQGGDIDNRLKTLFDALTMPRHENALPRESSPTTDENPFFCLLEDDNLVTAVAVRTEQLLEPNVDSTHVDLFINVTTNVTRQTMGNFAFS
ncbi:MAG: hypothetical protein OEW15_02230 [Nitrospirota bacterium]|nr:hypothetical protein [Nitrospirota bacterium]